MKSYESKAEEIFKKSTSELISNTVENKRQREYLIRSQGSLAGDRIDFKGTEIRLTADFSIETMGSRIQYIFKMPIFILMK